MALKYDARLPRCSPQPCDCLTTHSPRDLVAYRFVHRAAIDEDFVPTAALPSARAVGHAKCSNLALSFYSTVSKAQAQYRRLAERIDVVAKCGDHIGEISLTTNDGRLSMRASKNGHLNLFEEEGTRFVNRIGRYHPISLDEMPHSVEEVEDATS